MKKLLTIAVAALMAGVANAAAVSWNSGLYTEGFVGPDGNSLTRSTDYTMTVLFYSDADGKTLITESSVTSAKPNGAYNAKTGDLFSNGATYYVSAIISANDGSAKMEAALASFTLGDTGDATINFTSGAGFDTTTAKWSSSGWQTTAVPEPTSGLLLLLGVAGLALKRKVA